LPAQQQARQETAGRINATLFQKAVEREQRARGGELADRVDFHLRHIRDGAGGDRGEQLLLLRAAAGVAALELRGDVDGGVAGVELPDHRLDDFA